jgi:hypothetical protein
MGSGWEEAGEETRDVKEDIVLIKCTIRRVLASEEMRGYDGYWRRARLRATVILLVYCLT